MTGEVSCVCFFFFQAEDGIRDAQESRGLGDVYKGQFIGLGLGIAGGVALALNIDVVVPFIERMLGVHFLSLIHI